MDTVEPLLHLVTAAEWRAHLEAGEIAPSVAPFVHLSTPEQVVLPAGRLFAGRDDVLLLVLDPARIGVPVRWEPGLPTDPDDLRFPHAYGPIPVGAVLTVLPYREEPAGYPVPVLPALDAAGREVALELSIMRRGATNETEATGGFAVLSDELPDSRLFNALVVQGEVPAIVVVAEAIQVFDDADLDYRSVVLVGDHLASTASGLVERGWTVREVTGMAAPTAALTEEHGLAPGWTVEVSGPGDHPRFAFEDTITRLVRLALREPGGAVAGSCVLRLDGGTALVDGVEVVPEFRGRGLGDVLVAETARFAAAAGADLLTLTAWTDDWPAAWYARRGFADVSRWWVAWTGDTEPGASPL